MAYQNTRLPSQTAAGDFDLPDDRYVPIEQGPQPTRPGQYNPTIPILEEKDNLAEVEGLTDKYYDTYGKLKGFAEGMWKDYGLDITQPDFTQAGGGTPFKTYQRLAANLMHTSNKLGNRLKQQTQMQPYVATGQTVETSEGEYTPTALLPEVAEAVKQAHETYYTKGDARRASEAYIDPVLQKYQSIPEKDRTPTVKRQIQVLEELKTAYQTHPSYFRAAEDAEKTKRRAAAKALPELGVLKKLTSDKNGHWKPGSYTMKKDPETGEVAAFNPAGLEGKKLGTYTDEDNKTKPLIMEGLFRRPDKTTWVHFKSPDGEVNHPPIRIDNMTGDQFTAMIQADNPTFGKASNMSHAVNILGYEDPGGTVNEPSLFDTDWETVQGMGNDLDSAVEGGYKVEQEQKKIKEQLGELKGLLRGNNELKVGGMTIHNHALKSGYYIDENKKESLSEDDVIKLLEEKGYFDQFTAKTPEQKALDLINKRRGK